VKRLVHAWCTVHERECVLLFEGERLVFRVIATCKLIFICLNLRVFNLLEMLHDLGSSLPTKRNEILTPYAQIANVG
jgi:hypothetical protein